MNINFYYPGFVRKAMTFTIDDGHIDLDRKFLGYTEKRGFKGTFNLNTPFREYSPEVYREFYKGYEIANHCRYHAYPFSERYRKVNIADILFEDTAVHDENLIYPTSEPGIYRIHTYAWCYIADDEVFLRLAKSCNDELESVFGCKIRDFIWPCGTQPNENVKEGLKKLGFRSLRDAYGRGTMTYELPENRMNWCYTATCQSMEETGAEYFSLPDDGELRFYCFGVHSHDFEFGKCWNILEDFVTRYGNRPDVFWYATVGEIFDYEDAVKSVIIEENTVYNNSSTDIYAEINGKRMRVPGNCRISVT